MSMRYQFHLFTLAAVALMPAAYAQSKQPTATATERLFKTCYQKTAALSPMSLSWEGDYSRNRNLDDLSDATQAKLLAIHRQCLGQAKAIKTANLSVVERESLDIFIHSTRLSIDADQWRNFEYPASPINGWDTGVFQLFTAAHPISQEKDALAYLNRAKQVPRYIAQVRARIQQSEKAGAILPKPLFAAVYDNFKNLQVPAKEHPLAIDFATKLKTLKIAASKKQQYQIQLQQLLAKQILPAIAQQVAFLKQQELRAPLEGGLARIPAAAGAYNFYLRQHTTTSLNAAQVHELGRQTVAKLEEQMTLALAANGLPSAAQDRVAALNELRINPKFQYPNDAAGRDLMMREATDYVEQMRLNLPKLFTVLPKAKVIVERMPSFAEAGDAAARYQSPARDGSQPGKFVINLADTSRIPRYTMEALTYHEALPGHHLQTALVQENKSLPDFRQRLWYVAYGEGWALYAEQLGKEVGLYQTPISEVGRLSEQLWRACRLVVDTGLHSLQWTREQAVQYMLEHIPAPRAEAQAEVDRYLVWPGQATGYMIGKLRIEAARARATQALGDKFDVRRFHDVVLGSGPVPLDVLDTIVDRWIASVKKGG